MTPPHSLIKSLISNGDFVIVAQGGGWGIRSKSVCPKPLRQLGFRNHRPLSNVLKDLPREFPVFLHVLEKQRETYERFLKGYYECGHDINYLIQNEDTLFKMGSGGKIPVTYPNSLSNPITASDGPGTFARRFLDFRKFKLDRIPEYALVLDGSKLGIAVEDAENASAKLYADKSLDAVVFSRPLSEKESREEKERWEEMRGLEAMDMKVHTSFAYVNKDRKKVFEYPDIIPEGVAGEWEALGGVYVIRLRNYLEKTRNAQGELLNVMSGCSLWEDGVARQFKPAMALGDRTKDCESLVFDLYNPIWPIPGFKNEGDRGVYAQLYEDGRFGYRGWN